MLTGIGRPRSPRADMARPMHESCAMQEGETSHIRFFRLKNFLRNLLRLLRLNLTYAFSPGISLFGLNLFRDVRPGPIKFRATYALDHALTLNPATVLDVGSGGGYHAQAFLRHGARVLCVDYGTSVYAQEANLGGLEVVNVDFAKFDSSTRFDLVWASHVLEHQRNAGQFIEKLVECCAQDGTICITVPDPHRRLWGGHVSLWTPGLLAYNIALSGVDISDAIFVRGSNEFSIFFKPRKVRLPEGLSYDYGDLDKLAAYLPQGMRENADPWKIAYQRPA